MRLSLYDAPGIGLDDDDCGVNARQRLFRLFKKVDEAGRVHDGDVDVVGGGVREADGRGLEMSRVFGLVIRHGRSVGDRSAPPDRAGVGEDRLDQRGLSRVVGSDECDIPKAHGIRQCLGPPLEIRSSAALCRGFLLFRGLLRVPGRKTLGLGLRRPPRRGLLGRRLLGGRFLRCGRSTRGRLACGFLLARADGRSFLTARRGRFCGRLRGRLRGLLCRRRGRALRAAGRSALRLFFLGGAGLPLRAAFALEADADDSAERRDVLGVEDAAARFFGPASRVARAPSRRPAAPSTSSGKPSSARL